MAANQVNIPVNFTTDATFRAWVQAIHNAIAALGLVQTGDTGQIDPATVAKPAGTGIFQGYEVWRFDDALQATRPVFIKIEYGSANSAATRGGLRVQVGNATNGSGTLTGQLTQASFFALAGSDPVSQGSYFSGAANRLAFAIYADDPNNRTLLCNIERTHAADGSDTGGGFSMTTFAPQSGTYIYTAVPTPVGPIYTSQWASLIPVENSQVIGSDVAVYGLYLPPRISIRPLHGLVVFHPNDIANVVQFAADPDGNGNKNYVSLKDAINSALNLTTARVAMRFD